MGAWRDTVALVLCFHAVACSPTVNFVTEWLDAVAGGEVVPVAVRACPLLPASPPSGARCNVTGHWEYSRYGNKTVYPFKEDGYGGLHITSSYAGDPWTNASGQVDQSDAGLSQRCLGGMVPPTQHPDVTIHFNCDKMSPPGIITHTGLISGDCNTISMDDGGVYSRVASPSAGRGATPPPPSDVDGCMAAPLVAHPESVAWSSGSREGWRVLTVSYDLPNPNSTSGGTVLVVTVRVSVNAANSTVRVESDLTAVADLPFCLGGVAVLNLTATLASPDTHPAVLHASSGGPAGADRAFQPWVCPLTPDRNGSCDAVQGTPYRAHDDPSTRILSVDSGLDGRSSNFQLPIHSIEFGAANSSTARGLWMAPEYSGIWRLDAYSASHAAGVFPRFYYSLPSLLFTMSETEVIRLPVASFGVWDAAIDGTDWANAVRRAIAIDFTPTFAGQPPAQLAVYQGLGALPSYQTEDTLYDTAAHAQVMGLEAFVFDAGTYTWCDPISQCNGSAAVQGHCCAPQGDWWTDQGDYMPTPARFPEHGFMALEKYITSGIPNYGIWITPQAAPWSSKQYAANPELYLNQSGSSTACCSTSALLNLALPAAQDLFFGQFEEMIITFNASRIWFDYNTPARRTHWNPHEAPDRQGLLELGFYRGLYNVFDRMKQKYPNVWIEGCASGGRMVDLGSLSRTHSFWINDDSVSDDRNRRLRLGANLFLPAHYLQNAFLPFGCGAAPTGGGPASIDPDRLLTYFAGVLQLGQGVAFWSQDSVEAAAQSVAVFKAARKLMNPLTTRYYRLFEPPATTPTPSGVDLSANVGWVYEDYVARTGLVFLMRQSASPDPAVSISLTRPDWPWNQPAPSVVTAPGTPQFKILAGGHNGNVTVSVPSDGREVVVHIATPDTQVLLGYTF